MRPRIAWEVAPQGRLLAGLKEGLCWLALVAVCAATGGDPVSAQTVFPVRLDGPEASAPAAQAEGGLKISTPHHYQARIALTVIPGALESYLRVYFSSADTTLTTRVLGAAFTDDTPAILEKVYTAYYNGSGLRGNSVTVVAEDATGFQLAQVLLPAGPAVELRASTPAGYDLLTLWIEVLANKPVTFTELF